MAAMVVGRPIRPVFISFASFHCVSFTCFLFVRGAVTRMMLCYVTTSDMPPSALCRLVPFLFHPTPKNQTCCSEEPISRPHL
ncbi:hypothetical protein B0H66DRAFT_541765 [Apodospora peruviana]|uniref:Uncharacterized protein n=1 Tax=Apodospora peruviana TaxID=516989 RepID=A0AAE0MFE5_9PEZI|nr:hypothetical protein B0H66DRAFT_541765 [Apodospora peruviana]